MGTCCFLFLRTSCVQWRLSFTTVEWSSVNMETFPSPAPSYKHVNLDTFPSLPPSCRRTCKLEYLPLPTSFLQTCKLEYLPLPTSFLQTNKLGNPSSRLLRFFLQTNYKILSAKKTWKTNIYLKICSGSFTWVCSRRSSRVPS